MLKIVDTCEKSLIQSFNLFFFKLHYLLTGFGCMKIAGSNSLPSQMKNSYLSFQVKGWWVVWMNGGRDIKEKMQLDCLIKKNNEASWMLTGVWPREYSWSLAQLHCWQSSAVLPENNLIISVWSVFLCLSYYVYILFLTLRRGTCLKQLYLNTISFYNFLEYIFLLLVLKKQLSTLCKSVCVCACTLQFVTSVQNCEVRHSL